MAAALVLLHLVLALLCFVPIPFTGGDNASYVSLARSLLERGDYVELWDPSLRPHAGYPPVFPALLALLMAAGADSWVAFKLLVLGFSVAAVALSYLWLRRVAGPAVALAAGVLLAVSPGVLEMSHHELSDIPFWTFTMLALWAWAHLRGHPAAAPSDTPADGSRDRWWVALAIIATLLAYFTRSAGLPLLLAGAAWLALRRRWRELALLCGVVGIPALLWWARARATRGPGYLGNFWLADYLRPELGTIGVAGLVPRVLENAWSCITEYLPGLAITGTLPVGWAATPAFVAIAGLAAVGWARRARRPGVAELFFPLYLGMMLLLPASWQAHRYLMPLLPFVLLYAGESLHRLAARARRPWLLGAATAALCVAAAPSLVRQVRAGTVCSTWYLRGDRLACMTPTWRASFALAERTRGRLPPGSVVLARKPTMFYVLSGYPSHPYPFSERPEAFLAAARQAGAAYLLADQVTAQATMYLGPLLRARRLRLCTVPGLTLGGASMLRMDTTALLPPGAAPPPGVACPSPAVGSR